MTAKCRLCKAVVKEDESDLARGTSDFSGSRLRVLSDVSELSPGHSLITAKDHLASSAEALGTPILDDIADAIDQIVESCAKSGMGVIFFEHGSREGSRGGQCIEHLHVHALPTVQRVDAATLSEGMNQVGVGDLRWRSATGLHHIAALGEFASYYWLRDTEGSWWVSLADGGQPSQLWRRWCEATGLGSPWNWRESKWSSTGPAMG